MSVVGDRPEGSGSGGEELLVSRRRKFRALPFVKILSQMAYRREIAKAVINVTVWCTGAGATAGSREGLSTPGAEAIYAFVRRLVQRQ